jgi:predicted transcriptional regulator
MAKTFYTQRRRKNQVNGILRSMKSKLRLAVCSNLRSDLILLLKAGRKPLSELRDLLGVSSTTAIHALRELEHGNLICEDGDRNYALTKIGEIVALKLDDFLRTVEVLQKFERFWHEHDLSDIPLPLLQRIGELQNSMPLMGTPTDMFKLHTTSLQVLEHANEVKGIYPIFNLEYLTTIEEAVVGRRIEVELVITNAVLDSLIGIIETEERFRELVQQPNFSLFATEYDLKFALTLTDSVLYLGLFTHDGLFDYQHALISDDTAALAWGRDLHQYYRQHAKPLEW